MDRFDEHLVDQLDQQQLRVVVSRGAVGAFAPSALFDPRKEDGHLSSLSLADVTAEEHSNTEQWHDIARSWASSSAPASSVVLATGHAAIICGPVTGPEDPCPECVRLRWIALRPTIEREARMDNHALVVASRGDNPWAKNLVNVLASRGVAQNGTMTIVSLYDFGVRTIPVLKSSHCPSAVHIVSDRDNRAMAAEILDDLAAGRAYPIQTLNLPEAALIGEHVGALSPSLKESWDSPVNVAAHGVIRERSIFQSQTLEFGMNGHGATRAESRTLALLEGLERHSGLSKRNSAVTVRARYTDLGDEALDPSLFGIYPDEHFRSDRNDLGHVQWDPQLEIDWVRGVSLRTGSPMWVPQQMVYYLARSGGAQFVQDNSNGCAIGSTLAECMVNGALEVIERDSFLVHWLARAAMPAIDIECHELTDRTRVLIARLDHAGFQTLLFDARTDLLIPSVIAIVVRKEDGPGSFAIGASASLDPAAAVESALREASANAPVLGDLFEQEQQRALDLYADPNTVKQLDEHALMYTVPGALERLDFWLAAKTSPESLSERFGDWTSSELYRDLPVRGAARTMLDTLSTTNLYPVVVEQTSDEAESLGFRVAKTFIPGLLPLDFGATEMRALSLPRSHMKISGPDAPNPYPIPFS